MFNQRKVIKTLVISFMLLFLNINNCLADEGDSTLPPAKYSYYSLDKDIVTNFVFQGKHIKYIRAGVTFMVENQQDINILRRNKALIRDAIIEILGKQTIKTIKTSAGREAIRGECLTRINDLMIAETGRKVVLELLFSKYIYE